MPSLNPKLNDGLMLPDVLEDNLTIVFCGTAVGNKSAERLAYYAGPGNKFWRMLQEMGLTPRQFRPTEYPQLLTLGIGLTDLVKEKSGSDAELRGDDFDVDGFRQKILRHAPKILCFNGKKAGKVFMGTNEIYYGLLSAPLGETQLYVAPSTSGAANGYWDKAWWMSLGTLCQSV